MRRERHIIDQDRLRRGAPVMVLLTMLLILLSGGCKDDAPASTEGTELTKLNFGVGIGSQWTYRYTYTLGPHPPLPGVLENRTGRRVWELQTRTVFLDSIISMVAVQAIDTVRQLEYAGGAVVHDTTFVQTSTARFTVGVYSDSIKTSWMLTMRITNAVPGTITRTLPATGDTLKIDGTGYDYSTSWYVQGIGLVKYAAGHTSPQSGFAETLDLISVSLR